ncbi:glucose-6-phosphate isomerase [Anaerovorax odorimutans]|uniref:glucose-6-phosphate isomerase n=1 Tax=Anaerovorax odorimutans TaxID=109327 RepID=UPI0004218212|nr:glucose-6-phosphate isomerase [Anaerovorax odorimutans]
MNNYLGLEVFDTQIDRDKILCQRESLKEGESKLWSEKEEFTGWVKLPLNYDKAEIEKIIKTSEKIQKQCDAFIIIGIGGSYMGARAAIEMLSANSNSRGANLPEIYFAGQNLSGNYHSELLQKLKDKDVCICVISKSGTTTEPCIAFEIFKEFLQKKYGKEKAAGRIYVITDKTEGILREEAVTEGYESFVVPKDIGGRYSVLSSVGLLPIAAAGIDIKEMLKGAADITAKLDEQETDSGKIVMENVWQYAAMRKILYDRGKLIEVFEYYEPKLRYFAEWLKQLFGESEGKDGKGIFPVNLEFTTDLHSMGQFLQEGNQIFFETVLNVTKPNTDLKVPESVSDLLKGKSINEVNQAAVNGVIAAHKDIGIPIIKVEIPKLTPYYFGQMVYFFETSCALSAYLMRVNPFNQPGVEEYKRRMNTCLHSGENL